MHSTGCPWQNKLGAASPNGRCRFRLRAGWWGRGRDLVGWAELSPIAGSASICSVAAGTHEFSIQGVFALESKPYRYRLPGGLVPAGHVVLGSFSYDLPAVVVEQQVMPATQQDAVGDIGAAAISPPDDVVGLAHARRPVTCRVCAPAPFGLESGALLRGEQPLVAAHIQ